MFFSSPGSQPSVDNGNFAQSIQYTEFLLALVPESTSGTMLANPAETQRPHPVQWDCFQYLIINQNASFPVETFFYHLRQNLLVPTLPQGSYLEGMLHFIKYSFSIYRSSPIFLPQTQSLVKYKTGFIIINLYFQNKTILVQSVYVLFHSMC